MSRQNDAAPVIIIKRKKIVKGGGHHGGAWKVAYADFVTAMMAFFLMMWLLGATTESQRRGLADYFNPSVPVHRISSGGDGMFGGTDFEMNSEDGLSSPNGNAESERPEQDDAQSFEDLEQRLNQLGGESPVLDNALRHIITRQTDEGLVLEVFDLPGAPLFENDSDEPTAVTRQIMLVLSQVFSMIINPLAIEGHTRTYTVVQANDPRWLLSTARADRARQLLDDEGFDPTRMARVTGHADRRPSDQNPMAVRNNRLELILLRRAPR